MLLIVAGEWTIQVHATHDQWGTIPVNNARDLGRLIAALVARYNAMVSELNEAASKTRVAEMREVAP